MTTLNSSSRYSLTEAPNGYIFTTDYGNEYLVTFSDLTSIINLKGLKIYDFGIEVVNRNSVKNDKLNGKLKNTIAALLSQLFFKQPECAILIILDTTDNKHQARYRMFLSLKHNSWFKQFNNGVLEIIDLPLREKDFENVCFLLIRKQNPHLQDIQSALTEYLNLSFGND